MQMKRLALALLAAAPLFAHAQSAVTIYGIMDAALSIEDTDSSAGRNTVINSGNQSSSRIGFKGTEDLGNGTKALFNIEAGVSLDTGNADSAIFGRRAVVGLEGDFGTLTIGREYTPVVNVAGSTDINGQGFYGTNLSAFTRLTRRESNSINFKSAAMSGVKVMAIYGAGEKATGPSNDMKGAGLEYAAGDLYAGLAYQVVSRLDAGNDREYAIGAGYKWGALELKGNYMAADPQGAGNKFEQYNIGGAHSVGEAGKLFVNLQHDRLQNGARGFGYSIAYMYSLSKRTDLYTTFAQMRNNSMGTFGLNASSTNVTPPATAFGADPKVFNVGIRHLF